MHPTGLFRPKPLAALSGQLTRLVEGKLWLQVVIGMVLGLGVGVAIGPAAGLVPADTGLVIGNWLAFPGRLFLVTIQMIVVPLVFASIVRGLAAGAMNADLKRLALWVVGFFVLSTAISAAIGIQLALAIEPGNYLDMARYMPTVMEATASVQPAAPPALKDLPDMLLGVLPGNPLNAMVEGQMLQIVLFAVVIAVAAMSLPAATAKPLLDLLSALQEVCMAVVRGAMRLAPFAVFGLMAQLTSRTGLQTLIGLGAYAGTVLLGLLILLALYLLFVFAVARIRPLRFLRDTRELLLLAFSTSSSAAVMPLSMKTVSEKFQVRSSVAQFVIPLGATINMNGTALYQAVAAVFLAQVFGIDISTGGLVLIVAMAVGASIGSPATPGVGIVILASIVASIGVPPAGVALVMGVDRLLDMCRTAVNVTGDLVASIFADGLLDNPPKPKADSLSEVAEGDATAAPMQESA